MKPALRHLLVCALLLVAGFGAQAQGDEVLERYGLSLVNLSESVRLLDSDIAASRDELDSAASALRFLATEAGNPSLIPALERVFERARTAIANRSGTDLAVQNALIRGGYQRAVFESALALLDSEPATAQARLTKLATDLGFAEETRADIAAATNAGQVRRLFEAALADGVSQKLQSAEAQYAENKDSAYRTLASAYGDFLLIQDSPRAQMAFNDEFGTAATSLVENRGEGLSSAIAALSDGFRVLAEAARAQPVEPEPTPGTEEAAQVGPQAPTAEQGATEQTTLQAEQQAAQQQTDQQQAAAQPETSEQASEPEPAASTAAAEETAATPAQVAEMPPVSLGQVQAGQAQPAPAGPHTEQNQSTAPEAGAQPNPDLQALRVELIATGVPPAQAADIAVQLDDRGVTSLSAALDDLYAHAGRVVAAVQAGEVGSARSALEGFSNSYERQMQPALELISPAVDDRVVELVASLSSVPALRAQDALVLLGQVDAVGNLLAGEPSSNVQIINTQATMLWAGWARVAALIALAILAIVPLYLLNLAFGGGNRNWQLIGVALFLLLLPVIYEGLASIGAIAAHYSGIDVLASLLGFSMFHNPIAQVVWAAITAAAILFAVAGLYGICVQFGLLGSRRGGTVSDSQAVRSTAVVPDADTVVDWDEEF